MDGGDEGQGWGVLAAAGASMVVVLCDDGEIERDQRERKEMRRRLKKKEKGMVRFLGFQNRNEGERKGD